MQPDPGGAKKESTILELTLSIGLGLNDLQSNLNNRFDRAGKEPELKPESPVIPNVLDEIIKELEKSQGHLARITSFILSEVLPKIN